MEHKKTEIIPVREREVVDYVTCDICGIRIQSTGMYEVDEVTISRNVGTCYPEGSGGERTEYDVCGECFQSKLMPFIEGFTGNRRVEDYGY